MRKRNRTIHASSSERNVEPFGLGKKSLTKVAKMKGRMGDLATRLVS